MTVQGGTGINVDGGNTGFINLAFGGGSIASFTNVASTQKFGIFSQAGTAVVQQTASGATGFTANASANAAFAESTYTGGVGATAYTTGDVVAALKRYGLLVS